MRVKAQRSKVQTKTVQSGNKNGLSTAARGLHVSSRFTHPGIHTFDELEWVRRTSVIENLDGSVVFNMEDDELPA